MLPGPVKVSIMEEWLKQEHKEEPDVSQEAFCAARTDFGTRCTRASAFVVGNGDRSLVSCTKYCAEQCNSWFGPLLRYLWAHRRSPAELPNNINIVLEYTDTLPSAAEIDQRSVMRTRLGIQIVTQDYADYLLVTDDVDQEYWQGDRLLDSQRVFDFLRHFPDDDDEKSRELQRTNERAWLDDVTHKLCKSIKDVSVGTTLSIYATEDVFSPRPDLFRPDRVQRAGYQYRYRIKFK